MTKEINNTAPNRKGRKKRRKKRDSKNERGGYHQFLQSGCQFNDDSTGYE